MSIRCPICGKLVDEVNIEKSENAIVSIYACGHKHSLAVQIDIIHPKDSQRIKRKNQKGKALIESKIENQIEKRITRKPSNAMQVVFEKGKIVHVHCKSADCGNEWKMKDKEDLSQKFNVEKNQQGVLLITCKKCRRFWWVG